MRQEPAAADEARTCLRKLAALLQSQVIAVMNRNLIRVTYYIRSLALQTRRSPGCGSYSTICQPRTNCHIGTCTDTLHADAQLPAQARVRRFLPALYQQHF